MASISSETLEQKLDRLIAAVARLAPEVATPADLEAADCFVWTAERGVLEPVARVNRVAIDADRLRVEAQEWATTRGSRSGRVAWQFTQDLAGRLGQPLKD